MSYLHRADELSHSPEFYSVFKNSCGVNILQRISETGKTVFFGRDALLNGYWDRHLYANGVLDTHLPFVALREASLIDARAQAAGESPGFRARSGSRAPSSVTRTRTSRRP